MNHVQSVYISDIPPAGVWRFMGIYLLHRRWYITDIHLAMKTLAEILMPIGRDYWPR